MSGCGACALAAGLLFVIGPVGVTAAADHPSPSRGTLGTLLRLRRQHRSGDRLRVTPDSARVEMRVRHFDQRGLVDLTPRRAADRRPDPLSWARIGRIDDLRGRSTRGAVIGTLPGRVIGGRQQHEEELYRAASHPVPARDAVAEEVSPALSEPAAP